MAQEYFTYDWHMDDAPAQFLVDMGLSEAELARRPYLLYVQGKSRDGELSPREMKRLDELEKKCRKKLDAIFAGSIHTAERGVFFFYAKEEGALEAAQLIAAKEKILQCAAGLREEPERATFQKILYPDAARLFTEQNRKQLLLLKKHGDTMTASRRITLHVFFPAEPLVGLFAEDARVSGFAVGEYEYEPEQELPYGVALCRVSSLDKADIDALTTQAIRLAARYEGTLSYWNCPIVGKISPFR